MRLFTGSVSVFRDVQQLLVAAQALLVLASSLAAITKQGHDHHHQMPLFFFEGASAQEELSATFYATSCPTVASVVEGVVRLAVQPDPRMAAYLLRLHLHDCFVHGCDGSVLLDDTSSVKGEKTADQNDNSLGGFDVVDSIKTKVESVCKATVSCADILALAANASVSMLKGPSWTVLLGRRDATSPASISEVNAAIPGPYNSTSTIIDRFANLGLNIEDTVTLLGAHTIGQAHCWSFDSRLYNFSGTGAADPSIDSDYLANLKSLCPKDWAANTLSPLDVTSPNVFDNAYYTDLQGNQGLLLSDQELTSDSRTASLVTLFARNQSAFFTAFAQSIVKLGNISPLTGSEGEIRHNCRVVNAAFSLSLSHIFSLYICAYILTTLVMF